MQLTVWTLQPVSRPSNGSRKMGSGGINPPPSSSRKVFKSWLFILLKIPRNNYIYSVYFILWPPLEHFMVSINLWIGFLFYSLAQYFFIFTDLNLFSTPKILILVSNSLSAIMCYCPWVLFLLCFLFLTFCYVMV